MAAARPRRRPAPPEDIVTQAMTCPRCPRPLTAELVFTCNHKFCGYCIGRMWNERRQRIDCAICLDPGSYPDNSSGYDSADARNYRYSPVFKIHSKEAVSADGSDNDSIPSVHEQEEGNGGEQREMSVSRSRGSGRSSRNSVRDSPRLSLADTDMINILPDSQLPSPIYNLSPYNSMPPSPRPDMGERNYLLPRTPQKILSNSLLGVDNFGFAFLASHPCKDDIFVSDFQNHQILVLDMNGEVKRTFGKQGTGPVEFHKPRALDVTVDGVLVVVDYKNSRVQILNEYGELVHQFGSSGTANNKFWHIRGLQTYNDRIYVTDYAKIKVFDFTGKSTQVITHPEIRHLYGLAIDETGIYANDYYAHVVFKFDFNGRLVRRIGKDPDDERNRLLFPSGIQLDKYGYLVVCDHGNNRLMVYDRRGDLYCEVPVDDHPWDVAVLSDTTLVVSHCRQVGNGHVNLYY